ncbi:MAG: hypothetical protein ACR2MX_12205 [Cyclobacteriaceae bacterium]
MKQLIILFFLVLGFGSAELLTAQSKEAEKHYKFLMNRAGNSVSLGCGFAGVPSENLEHTEYLVENDHHDLLVKLLDSKIPATSYLAVVVIEDLNRKGKMDPNSRVVARIAELYDSKDLVSVCSGCTYHMDWSIKDLLTSKQKDTIGFGAEYWLQGL